MDTILDAVYDPLEGVFQAVGARSPLSRFVAAGAGVAIAVLALKPRAMFQGGQPRPFVLGTSAKQAAQRGVEPTYTPWWSAPLLAGVVSALFV
jgi:hypothetical protein